MLQSYRTEDRNKRKVTREEEQCKTGSIKGTEEDEGKEIKKLKTKEGMRDAEGGGE